MAVSGSANPQEHWSGRAAFILAAVGSAVGLGNLVRFPYVAGETGGGAFVLFYLVCILFIGLPVLCAELMIGRRGGGSAVAAIARLSKAEGKSGIWTIVGWLGMISTFLILTFYSVLAGWVLHFVLLSIGDLAGAIGENGLGAISSPAFETMSKDDISSQLGELLTQPVRMIIMHGIFMIVTIAIVMRGIKGGIEVAAKVLMPIFFILLLALTVSSLINGDAGAGFAFLFQPDFEKFGAALSDGSILLDAIGQAFFSLSLGSAMMITYGLYLSREDQIPGAARAVAFADTSVALIAGLAIFPIVFAAGLNEAAGFSLLFNSLPLAFHQLPFGGIFAIAFFIMTLFAALTSSIALLEVTVAIADGDVDVDPAKRDRRRVQGAIVIGLIAFGIGVANALSQVSGVETFFNTWHPLDFIPLFEGLVLLDLIDQLTANILLPLGGFLTAIFAGWVVSGSAAREELNFNSERTFKIWRFLCRWVCPLFVGLVLVYAAIIAPMLG
ncbi:sodium-dependent transporter [Parvularcula marina]|uniref:sodium-dependent transporter n=1 Tax=Parvularcula marina TaxID=2292771 RepID=UPI0035153C3A